MLMGQLYLSACTGVALGYALLMFVVSVADTLNNNQYMYNAMRIFLHLRVRHTRVFPCPAID
jgi:hypothetical protein